MSHLGGPCAGSVQSVSREALGVDEHGASWRVLQFDSWTGSLDWWGERGFQPMPAPLGPSRPRSCHGGSGTVSFRPAWWGLTKEATRLRSAHFSSFPQETPDSL